MRVNLRPLPLIIAAVIFGFFATIALPAPAQNQRDQRNNTTILELPSDESTGLSSTVTTYPLVPVSNLPVMPSTTHPSGAVNVGNTGSFTAGFPDSPQRVEKIYFPAKTKADELALRFLAILPVDLREQTVWSFEPKRNALTISAPAGVISTADQLIPRMDANLQLVDNFVEVGVAPAPADSQEPNKTNLTVIPIQRPTQNSATFGATGTGQNLLVPDSKRQDVAVFGCPPEMAESIAAGLRREFAPYPEIVIATDARAGKLLVYSTVEQLERVAAVLGQRGIAPQSSALEQSDWRIAAGTVMPITGLTVSRPHPQQTVPNTGPQIELFSPQYRKIQEIEKFIVSLFGERLSAIDLSRGTDPLAQQNRSAWRFVQRPSQEGQPVGSCDLQFDYLNQKIILAGSSQLTDQMNRLLVAIDRNPPQPGHIRRFISIRQSDPRKIQEVLEYDNRKTIRPPSSYNPVKSPSAVGDNRFTLQSSGGSDNVRLVNYQEGLAELSGGDVGGLESFDPQFGFDGQMVPGRGVGIVPDYFPQVLTDLDVVIIDAPEAEFKRIEAMIRDIEELAKLADPKIEVYNLKHVNCVMLQGILSQLHSAMFVTKQGRVLIYPLQNPNAILMIGWGQAFTSMKDLIDVFDKPIEPGGSMIRVIRLTYAPAAEVSLQLGTYFPMAQAQTVVGGFAPRIRVFPDIRTNSLVVHAAPNDMAMIEQLVSEIDVNKSAVRLRMQIFPLKYMLAEDLRRTIGNAILPSVEGTQDSSTSKFPILEILAVDEESKKLIESGLMTDVSITAAPNNNQLIVTAPEDCLDLVAKLINLLDVPPSKAQIKIFRIMYGDATQLSQTLQSLLPTGGGALPTLPNAEGESSMVPVRLAIDTRTNCIVAAAAPRDLKIIEALILSLDRKDIMERKEVVIPLRNVQALSIAKAIDDYLQRKQNLELASEAMSVYQMFESQVIVVPEAITNSLIISATPRYLDEITKLVESFDKDPPQVVIQVLIAEVSLGNHEEFGIEAGLQDSVAFDRSIVTNTTNGVHSATGNPGYDITGNNSQGNNMLSSPDPAMIAGQVLNTLGMGRTSADVGFGGLVLSASSRSVQVTLRALREKNRLQILSRPQITAMDNQQAFILVGQRVPRVEGANTTQYGVTSSVNDANIGLILLVTPRISKEGRVIMEIGAEKSSLAGESSAIPVFTSGDQVIKSPSIDTIQAMTAVSAMDGETVMLGGLITQSREKIRRGIPYVSDIPVLGWLFRYDKEVETRKELLIVMTPRVVRNQDDLENIKRVEASKMTWCLADAMAINGSMGLFDPLSGQSGSPKMKTKALPVVETEPIAEPLPEDIYKTHPARKPQK